VQWRQDAALVGRVLPGIEEVVAHDGRRDARFAELVSQIETSSVGFAVGSATVAEDQGEDLAVLAKNILELRTIAADLGREIRIRVVGHTDATGSPEYNLALSRQRAASVTDELKRLGVPTQASDSVLAVVIHGAGSGPALRSDDDGRDTHSSRRVSFEVEQSD
jgi:outer membrane protein OmpA-like peptidoglycan-associated protein